MNSANRFSSAMAPALRMNRSLPTPKVLKLSLQEISTENVTVR
ncbi:hypothetical protein [Streptomyces sp. NPDC052042]